jgi:regulator of chromosome condensation (RCC1) repeat-containing protein/Regulator of Chromosome Condensation (RCC1) repeat protein
MGSNHEGQAGLGAASDPLIATPIDTTNLGGRKITQVAAGDYHSLLLADDGSVFSFGSNANGKTGLGTTTGNTLLATPINTTNLGARKIIQITASHDQDLLLADDGSVFSFGNNASAQLGLGTIGGNVSVATPINTTNLGGLKITEVSTGFWHSLILAEDGRAFSFGSNSYGQLGLGSTISFVKVPSPINTTSLAGQIVTHVDAGLDFSLLLAEPALPGDYNHDGSVNVADYVVWRKSLGQFGSALAADGDQDHQVDADDYDVWRAHAGTSLGNGAHASGTTGVSSIPEPATLFLLVFGAAAAPHWRRRLTLS